MAQNIYDKPEFFEKYATINRSLEVNGALEWPSAKTMLPELEGLTVVDLGCGYGWFCRYAMSQGAKSVVGIDLSKRMLDKAKQLSTYTGISYREGNLERLTLQEDTFDLAYSSLTFHYVEDLNSLLLTIYNSLKLGGHLIFSVEHPMNTAPEDPRWVEENGRNSWLVNSYHREGKRVKNWLMEAVIKQHRLLATYINLLVESGFVIKKVIEWGPSEEDIARDASLKDEEERGRFLLISAQKYAF